MRMDRGGARRYPTGIQIAITGDMKDHNNEDNECQYVKRVVMITRQCLQTNMV